jgi:hypothetical protein
MRYSEGFNGKYTTHDYESEMKNANLALNEMLPCDAIQYLDIACWTVNNGIREESLCHFTKLIEFKMSAWICPKEGFIYFESPSWSSSNLIEFLKGQKNMQKLSMVSVHRRDENQELYSSFPTTLTHLNLEKLSHYDPNESFFPMMPSQIHELIKTLPNLVSLNVVLHCQEELDLSPALRLENLTIGTVSEYSDSLYTIFFNTGLRSLTTLENVVLTEESAISLFKLKRLDQLIMMRNHSQISPIPITVCSHLAGNTSLKKIHINSMTFWNEAIQYIIQCQSLEEFEVAEWRSEILKEESIYIFLRKLPNIKKWLGKTREEWESLASVKQDLQLTFGDK